MKKAIRNLVAKGKLDQLVISAFTYAHEPMRTNYFLKRRLKALGVSGHKRMMFQDLKHLPAIDIAHLRYSAAHRGAEKDIFPYFDKNNKPGIISFTATRCGKLLNPKKVPKGESPLTAADCYRYGLSNPSVDVCMMGIKNSDQLRENISIMEMGEINDEERKRIERIGEYVYLNLVHALGIVMKA